MPQYAWSRTIDQLHDPIPSPFSDLQEIEETPFQDAVQVIEEEKVSLAERLAALQVKVDDLDEQMRRLEMEALEGAGYKPKPRAPPEDVAKMVSHGLISRQTASELLREAYKKPFTDILEQDTTLLKRFSRHQAQVQGVVHQWKEHRP
jgi:hypothetical protein